jgi:DNA-binding beta-propeller fold protein YncE
MSTRCDRRAGVRSASQAAAGRLRRRRTLSFLILLPAVLALAMTTPPWTSAADAGTPAPGDSWYVAGGWSLPPHNDPNADYDVAADPSGNVFVCDDYNNMVFKYGGDGKLLQTWGTFYDTWLLNGPTDVAFNATDGSLYVVDLGNKRIMRLSASGTWSLFWQEPLAPNMYPTDVAVAPSGDVYAVVLDAGLNWPYVFKFSPSGTLRLTWGGEQSADPGKFGYRPHGIACNSAGHVLVSDTGNSRIQEFDGDGHFIRSWSISPNQPEGLAVGLADDVIVCDPAGHRLLENNREGMLMRTYSDPQLCPDDVAYGPIANVWVVDSQNMRLVHLQNDVTAPVTTATCQPSAWTVAYVTVTLAAKDDLSSVKSTEYRLGDGTWMKYTAPFVVDKVGLTTLGFRSTDVANNVEVEKTVVLGVDRTGPTTKALADVTVRRGKKATFRFKVSDLAPQADVVIRIFKGTALRKSLKVGSKATGRAQSYRWTCTLQPGLYTWKVCATDLAGNPQRLMGRKRLTVR